jgi:hypothetical protein
MRILVGLASAALLAAALAGCTGPAPADGPGPGPAPARPAFLLGNATQVAPVPNNQAEAVVTVAPDGKTVLTCFHGLFQQTSPGHASTDGGATWRQLAFPPEAGPGGDCETALLEDGSWAFLASTVAGATVLVSRDQGATWTVNQVTAIPTNGLADRPWLAGVGNELWLAYMPLNFQPGTVGFTKSADHGRTWSTPVWVGTPGPDTVSVRHGHPVVTPEGVQVPMVRYEPSGLGPRVVQVASSKDGASWSLEEAYRGAAVVGDWPSMAVTEAGDRLLLVTGTHNGTRAILGLHQPPGGAWSQPFPVHAPRSPQSASWPWVDAGNGRNATFVVEGAAHEGRDHLWVGRIDLATLRIEQWPVWPAPGVEFASVDHDAAGNAFVAWVDVGDAQYVVKGTLAGSPGG